MDNTLTSVLAALSGSIIGASTPVLSNFVLQRSVAQRELTNRELAQREELYSEFIRQGTGCYAKAISQSLENIDEIVTMYALVNRIRLFASRSVLEAAEAFVKKLVAKYSEKNMTIEQIKSVALEQHADPLNDFALKCRSELREVFARWELEKQIVLTGPTRLTLHRWSWHEEPMLLSAVELKKMAPCTLPNS
jgi:hypothetical protein